MSTNAPITRRPSVGVKVGGLTIGGGNPVVVQSMTNTATADIESTVTQVKQLAEAGSEIVRVTVNDTAAAQAVPYIRERLDNDGCHVPLVGDFHYIGHRLLADNPDCAKALAKYRINPGNVGFREKRDGQFSAIIETAIKYDKAVRIGVNWGSLDGELQQRMMDENAKLAQPKEAQDVMYEAMIKSALDSAATAEEIGLPRDHIILSAKMSGVQDLVAVYRRIASRCDYTLHLGLTEAGMGTKGVVASAAALGILLQEGIGDTIRISITPEPGGARTKEVQVAQELLQSMGIRSFSPIVAACPGCGRTTSTFFQELAEKIQGHLRSQMPIWRQRYVGVEDMQVAVMGCVVNGPGESKHANIGISLPGTGEAPSAPVFIDGEKAVTLRGENIAAEFQQMVDDYVAKSYAPREAAE